MYMVYFFMKSTVLFKPRIPSWFFQISQSHILKRKNRIYHYGYSIPVSLSDTEKNNFKSSSAKLPLQSTLLRQMGEPQEQISTTPSPALKEKSYEFQKFQASNMFMPGVTYSQSEAIIASHVCTRMLMCFNVSIVFALKVKLWQWPWETEGAESFMPSQTPYYCLSRIRDEGRKELALEYSDCQFACIEMLDWKNRLIYSDKNKITNTYSTHVEMHLLSKLEAIHSLQRAKYAFLFSQKSPCIKLCTEKIKALANAYLNVSFFVGFQEMYGDGRRTKTSYEKEKLVRASLLDRSPNLFFMHIPQGEERPKWVNAHGTENVDLTCRGSLT